MIEMQLSVDFMLIGRCLLAFLWGIGLACFLQFSRIGQYIATARTWISVVIGVGVDLLLGIGAAWWVMWLVVALSSLGVITRSLFNEHNEAEPALNRYRTKWQMEDTIDCCGSIIGLLTDALEAESADKSLAQVSKALAKAHNALRLMTEARYGRK
ncbi:MAG: hypothetical protein M0R37_11765 [Bacteroidales bacterium]|jgi:hypothetical protein|nr:hypothetical protein [Bacteroidales bacterium]